MNILLLFLCFLSFSAEALEVRGHFTQGGLLIGQAQAGSAVRVNGEAVPVAEDGSFAYGLSRKAGAEVKIEATAADGVVTMQSYIISPRKFEVQHIKGVASKHVTPRAEKDLQQIAADSAAIKRARAHYAALPYFKNDFILPAKGRISGVYGSRRTYNGEERNWHKGLDIAAPTGTPVYAPADGVVRLALPMSFFNGNLIILDHGQQVFTLYAHLNKMHVVEGDKVMQGQHIADIGTTGRSTGPHLHWGLSWRGVALDPALLVADELAALK